MIDRLVHHAEVVALKRLSCIVPAPWKDFKQDHAVAVTHHDATLNNDGLAHHIPGRTQDRRSPFLAPPARQ
jgi:hypothetical protein